MQDVDVLGGKCSGLDDLRDLLGWRIEEESGCVLCRYS